MFLDWRAVNLPYRRFKCDSYLRGIYVRLRENNSYQNIKDINGISSTLYATIKHLRTSNPLCILHSWVPSHVNERYITTAVEISSLNNHNGLSRE